MIILLSSFDFDVEGKGSLSSSHRQTSLFAESSFLPKYLYSPPSCTNLRVLSCPGAAICCPDQQVTTRLHPPDKMQQLLHNFTTTRHASHSGESFCQEWNVSTSIKEAHAAFAI